MSPVAEDPFDAVCFDLDDTLYAYREYARAGLAAAADRLEAETGESYHEELQALYFEAGVTDGTFDRLVERHGIDETVVEDLVAAYHDATGSLSPYDETETVLSRLASDHGLGLITDGRGGRAKLRRLGIEGYFDAVVVSPELDSSKHQREVFDRALSLLEGDTLATMYVGDDPRVDFRLPNRLGMDTVRIRRGRYVDLDADEPAAAPDAEIERLDELVALIE